MLAGFALVAIPKPQAPHLNKSIQIAKVETKVAAAVPQKAEITPEPTPQPTPVATEQPPAVTTAVKTPDPSGCVTGYTTGNYVLDYVISHESGGNSCATNYLGCFGLLQACPGQPLRDACGGNPDCQIKWFWDNKVASNPKYGSWDAVYNFWLVNSWW